MLEKPWQTQRNLSLTLPSNDLPKRQAEDLWGPTLSAEFEEAELQGTDEAETSAGGGLLIAIPAFAYVC